MGAYFPTICRLVRRLDCVAETYEATVDDDHGRRDVDWMVSGLLCLWALLQVGTLTHYLQVYPLF